MCGITGFAGIKSSPSIIEHMIGKIKHRGPDHDGYCVHEDMAVGMTRLSIVDLHAGAQPMHSSNGALSIVFNGEIYNHRELAAEYIAQGGILKTNSDTEVVLALYSQLKEACLDKLQGMFAFAILDRREKSLFIARDRVGIKPLYYWHTDSTLVFGSEIKSLLASNQFKVEANLDSIPDYLALRYVPSGSSLFKGIKRLAPGHWMKWHQGKIQQQCYWRPRVRQKQSLSEADFQQQFDSLFERCVDTHRMGDVPHGAYLSGGIDSTAVVQALARNNTTPLKTFTVGFGWQGDELEAARNTAQLLGTEHHEIICRPDDFSHLPNIIWHSDEPLGDPIVLPTYLLAKEASQHVKIVLTGEGADEILGGYLFHKAVYMADLYRRFIPNPLHKIIKPVISAMPAQILDKGFNYPGYLGESGKQRLLSFLQQARNNDPAALLKFFITLFNPQEQRQILHHDFASCIDNNQTLSANTSEGSILDKILMLQYHEWLPDNILMRQDKMSMAHGLEARVPFLDHELIEFMETVPDHLKLKLSQNKILLRRYAMKYPIKKIASRKKNAFYFPMEQYFKANAFQELLNSTLNKKQVADRGLFNPLAIDELMVRMEKGDFLASKQVFSLISLELWFQTFIDKQVSFV